MPFGCFSHRPILPRSAIETVAEAHRYGFRRLLFSLLALSVCTLYAQDSESSVEPAPAKQARVASLDSQPRGRTIPLGCRASSTRSIWGAAPWIGAASSLTSETPRWHRRDLRNLAIQRALSAAYEQDRAGIEGGLMEAVTYWPTNPEIKKFTEKLLEKTDIKDMAALDFDRFIRQDDYRAIFNDRFRFAAALALDEGRNAEFLDIMKRMEVIESAMAQAQELSRIQNAFGAWEVLERVYREYPEDQELNRLRGDFAVKAAQFASVIASAEQAREKENYGKALFAYLEAQKLYPASFFVEEGIAESVDAVLADKGEASREEEEVAETESSL